MPSNTLILAALLAIGAPNALARSIPHPRRDAPAGCRNVPGDAGWPSRSSWAQLNQTVNGNLISAVPLGAVCHGSTYSAEECAYVQENWGLPAIMVPQPVEFMSTWFQNNTCNPFSDDTTACELGNYVNYAINVTDVSDVQAGLTFAQQNNLRLVVKNSGHDFYGKSTGHGALSLWVHNLNSAEVISNYDASYYQGPAIKVGTGIEGGALAQFASENGLSVVAGSCPTVKPAGGYTQGGGHSYLTGMYGFGADNVLEWEVVLANGTYAVVNPTNEYRDLYWAISGGGGGSWGVVLSMTVRAFPGSQTAASTMSFNVTTCGGVDQFWAAIETFHAHLQTLVADTGIVCEYSITNTTLDVFGLFAPNMTSAQLNTALQPLMAGLADHSLSAQNTGYALDQDTSYFPLYARLVEPLTAADTIGPVNGGRFVSRDNLANNSSAVHAALRNAVSNGDFIMAITALNGARADRAQPIAANAMQPAFKDAFLSVILAAPWDWATPFEEAVALQAELHDEIMPQLEAATPGAGAYINEANWQQDNWQQEFYGSTYAQLLATKQVYDPTGVFYGLTAVGSESYEIDSAGRLCSVA